MGDYRMKLSLTRATKVISVLLAVLSLVMYFVVCPRFVPDVATFGVSPRAIPNLCFLVVGLLSVGLFLEAHFEERKNKKLGRPGKTVELDKSGLLLLLFAVGMMLLYQAAVYKIGYIITVAVILAVSMYVFGQRSKLVIVLVSISVPVAYYCFFTYLLKMRMP